MSEPTEALAWVHRAEEDRLLVHSVFRRKVPLSYGTTFHTQQCVEKCLKAVLVSRQHMFPYGHGRRPVSRRPAREDQ
jgi:HEPN domain-containing protein